MSSRAPNVLLSASTELDNLARYVHDVELRRQQQQQQQQQLMQLIGNVVPVQYSPGNEPPDPAPLPEPDDDTL